MPNYSKLIQTRITRQAFRKLKAEADRRGLTVAGLLREWVNLLTGDGEEMGMEARLDRLEEALSKLNPGFWERFLKERGDG